MSKSQDNQALNDWRKLVSGVRERTHLESYGTKEEQRERIERAKKDYSFFVEYYMPTYATSKTPDFHVKAANRIKRNAEISIWHQWGRGLAKSVVDNVTIPLWLWIQNDIKFMVVIGQNESKAELLLDDIRAQFEGNERLIHDFGVQRTQGQWEKGFFITQNGFIGYALGKGQDPRGLRVGPHRPDYISCDDWEDKQTIKNPKRQDEDADWLLTAVLPLMDGERQRCILSQNRFAPRMAFSKIIDENQGWKVHRVDAFDPKTGKPTWSAKYKPNYYKKLMIKLGVINVKAEYGNDPHVKGKIFLDKYIQWTRAPRLNQYDAIIGFWDVAWSETSTADFNAVRIWGIKDGRKYLIDCFVQQCKVRSAIEWIADFQKNLPKTVSVQIKFEEQFWNNEEITDTIEEIEEQEGMSLNVVKYERSKVNKYDRICSMLPDYQNGKVYYSDKLKDHNDTKEGLSQLKGIEPKYSGHDDAPDADEYAFKHLDKFKRKKRSRGKHFIHNRQTQKY